MTPAEYYAQEQARAMQALAEAISKLSELITPPRFVFRDGVGNTCVRLNTETGEACVMVKHIQRQGIRDQESFYWKPIAESEA